MAESVENLDNILRDWAKDKIQKSVVETLNRCEKQEEEQFFLENDSEKILEQSQPAVEHHCLVSNVTSPINKMVQARKQ